jgi:hypothetical protein
MAAITEPMDDEFTASGPLPIARLEGPPLLIVPFTNEQGNGISAGDIKKFIEAGFNTVESVAYT